MDVYVAFGAWVLIVHTASIASPGNGPMTEASDAAQIAAPRRPGIPA